MQWPLNLPCVCMYVNQCHTHYMQWPLNLPCVCMYVNQNVFVLVCIQFLIFHHICNFNALLVMSPSQLVVILTTHWRGEYNTCINSYWNHNWTANKILSEKRGCGSLLPIEIASYSCRMLYCDNVKPHKEEQFATTL